MQQSAVDFVVVGGGAFGSATAVALAERGYSVALLDPGPLPHPEASSTDISKIVRMDYGNEAFYASLSELAISRWHEWNQRFDRPLYRETGLLMLSDRPLESGGFEYESRRVLATMGYPVQELNPKIIERRFPAWNHDLYGYGYFNPAAGWVESGSAVERLLDRGREAGVDVREGIRVTALVERGGRVIGVDDAGGDRHHAGGVIVAAGAWTPELLPWTAGVLRSVAQPVFHLKLRNSAFFQPAIFPVWCADISRTGWYGFPVQPDGVVKIANHGRGLERKASAAKVMSEGFDGRLREFLSGAVPELADAPIVHRRLCLYCDTPDGDFWIDRDPDREGLTVAAGGSGHGFKFLPVLGEIVADAVEGNDNRWLERFAWREPGPEHREGARSDARLD